MPSIFRRLCAFLCFLAVPLLTSGCGDIVHGALSYAPEAASAHRSYAMDGDTSRVLDPSIIQTGGAWYAFSTDVSAVGHGPSLPIRCSPDRLHWRECGHVFPDGFPGWIRSKIPGIDGLWAPDISYFAGLYHLYYVASIGGTNQSVMGVATSPTLDTLSAENHWTDRGMVMETTPAEASNALDPHILVEADHVWLTYGSYFDGIHQREIDPATGKLLNSKTWDLATRPGVRDNPIEGAALLHHGNFYYLFVSVDHCCTSDYREADYKEAVGRSTSPHGPFVDQQGTAMQQGGGTVILKGNADWGAPGGATPYVDADGNTLLAFHAFRMAEAGRQYLWVQQLSWVDQWPVVH